MGNAKIGVDDEPVRFHLVGRALRDFAAVAEHQDPVGEVSITTPMPRSIKAVVPNYLFASRMKRHISSFSSRFMPAIGLSMGAWRFCACARPRDAV
jgi:hypothetical protein